jgi:hypothetical protein
VKGGLLETEERGELIKINYRRVIAPSTQNKFLSAANLANMRERYDQQYYSINVLGQDGDYTVGLVSYGFSDLNIVETEYKPDLKLHITCDFNVDPMSWALAHRYNGEYHFFDEIVMEQTSNIPATVDEFFRRYPHHKGPIEINGDASGNARNVQNPEVGGTSYTQLLNRMSHHGYKAVLNVREENPPIHDRVAAWNSMVCNTEGVRRVYINPRCKWLIWNCQNLKYDEKGRVEKPTTNKIKEDRKEKFKGHVFDAASYLVEKHDPIILKAIQDDPGVHVRKSVGNYLKRV